MKKNKCKKCGATQKGNSCKRCYNIEYYRKNKRYFKQYHAADYNKNREKYINNSINYYWNNIQQRKEYNKKYNEENREYKRGLTQKNIEKNKDLYHQRSKQHYKNNIEHYKKLHKDYNKTPEGKAVNIKACSKRRYKYKKIVHNFTPKQWSIKVKSTQGICPLCFKPFEKNYKGRLTMDHEPALDNVGVGHIYDIDDITPMCQSCNSSKRKKSIKINFQLFLKKIRRPHNEYPNRV